MAKLVSRLTFISRQSDAVLEKALDETADHILKDIKAKSPVDTGTLRDSYERRQKSPLHIVVGTDVGYAPYMEYGFRHWKSGGFIGPFPHITPAFFNAEEFIKRKSASWMKTIDGVS